VLPSNGLLQFWSEPTQRVWGFDPADRGAWFVRHVPGSAVASLVNQQVPKNDDAHPLTFPASGVEMQVRLTLPPWESKLFESLGLTDDEKAAFSDAEDETENEVGVEHQLLGHPRQIQGDMSLDCQLVSNGLYCGDATGYQAPERPSLEPGALDWRLLLQLDSDEITKMMWGDAGRRYFWMRRADLEARAFERAWMILQCY